MTEQIKPKRHGGDPKAATRASNETYAKRRDQKDIARLVGRGYTVLPPQTADSK